MNARNIKRIEVEYAAAKSLHNIIEEAHWITAVNLKSAETFLGDNKYGCNYEKNRQNEDGLASGLRSKDGKNCERAILFRYRFKNFLPLQKA